MVNNSFFREPHSISVPILNKLSCCTGRCPASLAVSEFACVIQRHSFGNVDNSRREKKQESVDLMYRKKDLIVVNLSLAHSKDNDSVH